MLIGGTGLYDFICDECVSLSMQVISDLKPNPGQSQIGWPDEEPAPKYFGTIENWAGMTNDELIDRFHKEKAQEKTSIKRFHERYMAIFKIRQGRGVEDKEIYEQLLKIPTLKSRLDMPRQRAALEERNSAWEAVKAMFDRVKADDLITAEELIVTFGNYVELEEKWRKSIGLS